ncbi:MAG: hypothetical protein N3A72_02270, partial [bacterium]|nr:hypothetical protein [bacterium]
TGTYTTPTAIFNPVWITTDGTECYSTFAYSGDIDWAKFFGKAGRTYRIRVTSFSPGVSIKFYLYGPNGKTLLGYGYTELVKQLSETGIYYIKIINELTGTGGYSISITDITPTSIPPELWKEY